MSTILKALAKLAILFAIGFFVVGPLIVKVARADDTVPTTQAFPFECTGQEWRATAQRCGDALMARCPLGVYLEAVASTDPQKTPAKIEGIARCRAQKPI